MKRFILILTLLLNLTLGAYAQSAINWLSLDQAIQMNSTSPKKFMIFFCAEWNGWCPVFENKILDIPSISSPLNNEFYCVKFDTDAKEDIEFKGKVYKYDNSLKYHELALELIPESSKENGIPKMGDYPIIIFYDNNMTGITKLVGYYAPNELRLMIEYIASNSFVKESPNYKTYEEFLEMKRQEYNQSMKSSSVETPTE